MQSNVGGKGIRKFISKHRTTLIIAIVGSLIAAYIPRFTDYGMKILGSKPAPHRARPGISRHEETETEKSYRVLQKINTGLNINFIESTLGKPAIVRKLPEELQEYVKSSDGRWEQRRYSSGLTGLKERAYVDQKYFLQIVEKDGTIVSYAITTRSPEFNPVIPLHLSRYDPMSKTIISSPEVQLGKTRFADLDKGGLRGSNRIARNQNPSYAEVYYFGNPGNYKHYLFAWSPSGYDFNPGLGVHWDLSNIDIDPRLDQSLKKLRIEILLTRLIPNTFAVVYRWEGTDSLVNFMLKERVGIDYFDAREFFKKKDVR